MEVKNSDQWLNECQIAWLTVEKDLNAKMQTPESLKYGKQAQLYVITRIDTVFRVYSYVSMFNMPA